MSADDVRAGDLEGKQTAPRPEAGCNCEHLPEDATCIHCRTILERRGSE